MDKVFIRELHVTAIVGVYAEERRSVQTIHLDVELGGDFSAVSRSDKLDPGGVDYQQVATDLAHWIEQGRFATLEALAAHCAERLLAEHPLQWARLTVSKPAAVANCRAVGVCIERGRVS